ncbi:MAG: aldehyde dehydrogenase family protein [Candidatus Velthaea sp.]|jgi:aldehyde dehydrogenase (NAD+)
MIATPSELSTLAAGFERLRGASRREPMWTAAQRRARLTALERAILRRRDAIRVALREDFGKPAIEAEVTEIVMTLAELRHARKHVAEWMAPRRVATPPSLFGATSEIRSEPRGVVLILAPWNYPFLLALAPLIAALAAGNRALVRPSEKTPHTRAVLAAILTDAFPADEVAFAGGEADSAAYLTTLPFDHLFFTGSTAVGGQVMAAASATFASVTLELGGKSPAILAPDADVARAAAKIAWGKGVNAGQTCIAPDYVLAPREHVAALAAALGARFAAMYGATAELRARSGDYCRIIDDAAFARITGLLDQTLARGATLAFGGARDAATRYIEPTVVTGVEFDAPLLREEIFGPVLPIVAYDDLDAALATLRTQPKPLALYAFGSGRDALERILALPAGGATVNDTLLHFVSPNVPFGGVGASGMGAYHGSSGFRALSHEKAVVRMGPVSTIGALYPPFGAKARAAVAFMERVLLR